MRYIASQTALGEWFADVRTRCETTCTSWDEIARLFGVTGRTLYEWRKGKSTIPVSVVVFARKHLGIGPLRGSKKLDDSWSKVESGKIGGLQRIALYGNPGTASGGRLGGLRSIATHKLAPSSPFLPRRVSLPSCCTELAEFVGIVLGDGGVQKRQIVITLHKEDDKAYANYVEQLIGRLFKVKPSLVTRRGKNAVDIILSRVAVVQFLQKKGINVGDKVLRQVDVPKWIRGNATFESACIRGLFDTDGCFYIDRHSIKGKVYLNCGMNFTNRSLPLLAFFKQILIERGYHPTQRTAFSVFLRRENEILRYMKEIGSSNEKVRHRFKKYFNGKYGRVPKRS